MRESAVELPPSLRMLADRVASAIEGELVVEREGWAPQLVARVCERFAATGAPLALETSVVWESTPQAITLIDGRTYVSRELLSRGLSEGGLAFVLAHEQAHHDLGHFDALVQWSQRLGAFPGSHALAAIAAFVSDPDDQRRELDADRTGFDRCVRAGYELDDMLSFFRIVQRWHLDYRNLSQVWTGPLTSASTHPPVEVRVSALRSIANPREMDFATWVRTRKVRR